ncbi:MAG TPA: response regulator transcription factor [Ktedonobacterales bacterium]
MQQSTAIPHSENAATRIRVVVVDDQTLLREGISTLLEMGADIQVIGKGANGQEAIELAERLRPDVLLLDIRMPVMDGIQAIREIKQRMPDMRVVVLTSYAFDGYVLEGLMAGADGYLLKDASPAALRSGVMAVANGEQVIEPGVGRQVVSLLGQHRADRNQNYDGLTSRELQILAMIARGAVAKEIAHELDVSVKTVRNHISNIYQKLGIFDRSQLVLYAIKRGLIAAE